VPSPMDRFTRLEKVAVFIIALGEERTREILSDVDLDTIEQLNAAIHGLGAVSAEEKAAIMLEFAEFFYEDRPIGGTTVKAGRKRARPAPKPPADAQSTSKIPKVPPKKPKKATDATDDELAKQEQAILHTLEKLRQRLDPGQIDWGKAGYDFGDGFKGPEDRKR
jgi:hypothetical protein